MGNGDRQMKLTAIKLIEYKNKQGAVWYKGWHLKDLDTQKIYGMMVYNTHWTGGKCLGVSIYSPIHSELGCVSSEIFATREEALTWAREQIESLREPTLDQFQKALDLIKDARYRAEMSDDFAYTNGTIARWDQIEREVRNLMENAK
jgi:hypothetical protein